MRTKLACLAVFLGPVVLLASLATSARAGYPSPTDWRDQVIYQVVTDRFANGSASNDALEGNYDPANGSRIQGGDFRGLEQNLDYLSTRNVVLRHVRLIAKPEFESILSYVNIDEVTSVYNRRYFNEVLVQEWSIVYETIQRVL